MVRCIIIIGMFMAHADLSCVDGNVLFFGVQQDRESIRRIFEVFGIKAHEKYINSTFANMCLPICLNSDCDNSKLKLALLKLQQERKKLIAIHIQLIKVREELEKKRPVTLENLRFGIKQEKLMKQLVRAELSAILDVVEAGRIANNCQKIDYIEN